MWKSFKNENYFIFQNKMIRKHLQDKYFNLIASNLKTVEGRLNKGDFKNLKINDEMIFFND